MSTLVYDPHIHDGYPKRKPPGVTKLGIGLAAMTVDRLHMTGNQAVAVAVGFAAEALDAAARVAEPSRAALNRIGVAASKLPVVGPAVKAGNKRWNRAVDQARHRGNMIIAESRAHAAKLLQSNVDEVTPQVVELVLPHIVNEVMPRLMPVVIADLSNDPQIRTLLVDQSRGAVGDATKHIHETAARADDQVESSVRRFFGGGNPTEARD